jgi:hypothetical protein
MTDKEFNDGAHRLVEAINQILALHFWELRVRPRLESEPDFKDALVAFNNAILESCLANFRALDAFFANRFNPGKADDLVARDLGSSPSMIFLQGINARNSTKRCFTSQGGICWPR